jgi:penicillin-binding protein 1C
VHQIFPIDQITGLRRSHPIPDVTKPVLFEVWPSDLMELFAAAGLSRASPPALDPADAVLAAAPGGWKPEILSPVKGLSYRSDEAGERIPLAAAVGSDAIEAWWFIDGKVIGHAPRGESLLWKPLAGRHRARVVDAQGRSAEVSFDVAP